jgi:hypothetical protein
LYNNSSYVSTRVALLFAVIGHQLQTDDPIRELLMISCILDILGANKQAEKLVKYYLIYVEMLCKAAKL